MKIGDLVRVKDNLQVGSYYGGILFTEEMEGYKGKVGEVVSYNSDGYIAIEGFYTYFGSILIWSVDMIEPLKKEFTVYSSPTKFFIEKDGVYTEVNGDFVEVNRYPKEGQVCYGVDFNNLKYCAYKFKWYDSEPKRKLFDAGHIFTDKEKAEEVADKFNKVILDNQQKM